MTTVDVNVLEFIVEVLGCIWLQKAQVHNQHLLRDCLKVSIGADEEDTRSEEAVFKIAVQYAACWLTDKLLQDLVAVPVIFLKEHKLTTSDLHAAPQTAITIANSGEGIFSLEFKVIAMKSKMLTQCLGISKRLHRIKIVQPQIIMTLTVNVCGKYEDTFGETDDKWKVLKENKMLITSIHHYIGKEYAEFLKFKLQVGNPVELAGLKSSSGEPFRIKMTPATALLTPKNNSFTFSKVAVFAYCPGMCPMLECQDLTFFEDPQTLAKWNEFHQESLLLEKNNLYVEGVAHPDILFNVGEPSNEQSEAGYKSVLLIFLFFDFFSELTSSLHGLRVLLKDTMQKLPEVLKSNQSSIKNAIHDTLEKVLVPQKRQNKMLLKAVVAIPLLAESLHGIVTRSTHQQFRERYFREFKCSDSQELSIAIQDCLIDIAGSSMGIDKAKLKAGIIPCFVTKPCKTDGLPTQNPIEEMQSSCKNISQQEESSTFYSENIPKMDQCVPIDFDTNGAETSASEIYSDPSSNTSCHKLNCENASKYRHRATYSDTELSTETKADFTYIDLHKVSNKLSTTKQVEDMHEVTSIGSSFQNISGSLALKCKNKYFPTSDMFEEKIETTQKTISMYNYSPKTKKMCLEQNKHKSLACSVHGDKWCSCEWQVE
ncbi:type 2 DNA topoisomerase 6 subunit B-like isoform X2 [Lethenteron reissneri]|uniref:type 2 DNA topoisomerase 6 subunit B-like isoform X2 n=1 Tax=Lethenteron reissneri TaxID=7753 RepID=UPI002AB64637|nr:type 2 DNA topoisomerase 6 subunit B-like isoform X2 [Lethenteron reissneri]